MTTAADPNTAIETLYSQWISAFQHRDVEAILALVTPDYLLWAPGAPPLVGREVLRPMLAAALAKAAVVPAFELEERIVSGDVAVDRGWDVQRVLPSDGSAERVQRQRVMMVLRRDAAGTWRFARGMSQPGPMP